MKKKAGWSLLIVSILTMLMSVPAYADTLAGNAVQNSRMVIVESVDGVAQIYREGTDKLCAKAGTQLMSGDIIRLGKDSYLHLKMDSDKYLMAYPGTSFKLEVDGTEKYSVTKITINYGGIMSRLDNKLNKNSSYEVYMADSVLSVRGTVTKQEVGSNPDGSSNMKVDVYEGSGELKSIKKAIDGNSKALTVSQKILPGESLKINTDSSGAVATETVRIDFSKQSTETLQFLVDSTVTGREFTVDVGEIQEQITKQKSTKQEEEKKNSSSSSSSEDTSDWAKNEEPDISEIEEELPD